MLQIIIFSFNRAIQLDTLLTSFRNHWKAPAYQVNVIYNTSNEFFQKGYNILMNKFMDYPELQFHKETKVGKPYRLSEIVRSVRNAKRFLMNPRIRSPRTNFRQLLIGIMEGSTSKEVMFMTDDAMYINDVNVTDDMIQWLEASPRHRQISLRLGVGMNQQPDGIGVGKDGLMKWDMCEADHMTNWGYRFSVDAHIYDKRLILDYYKNSIFVNPNTLEGYIEDLLYKDGLAEEACCLPRPMLLSFPINMVQSEACNESLGVDCEKLNQMYLDGYELVYPIPDHVDMFQVYPQELFFFKDGRKTIMATK